MTGSPVPVIPCLRRRSVLAAAVGLVGVVAGCGTEAADDPRTAASTPVEDPAPTAAAPGPVDPTVPGAGASAGVEAEPADGTGVAIADIDELAVGGGAVVPTKGGPVVLVRASGDRVSAYRAACPHAGVTVNAPSDGTITCPAHGSRFRAGTGARIAGPATEGLTRVSSTTTGGKVYLT
jgi:cytochrome b6-f complex iron-sulfur subunit